MKMPSPSAGMESMPDPYALLPTSLMDLPGTRPPLIRPGPESAQYKMLRPPDIVTGAAYTISQPPPTPLLPPNPAFLRDSRHVSDPMHNHKRDLSPHPLAIQSNPPLDINLIKSRAAMNSDNIETSSDPDDRNSDSIFNMHDRSVSDIRTELDDPSLDQTSTTIDSIVQRYEANVSSSAFQPHSPTISRPPSQISTELLKIANEDSGLSQTGRLSYGEDGTPFRRGCKPEVERTPPDMPLPPTPCIRIVPKLSQFTGTDPTGYDNTQALLHLFTPGSKNDHKTEARVSWIDEQSRSGVRDSPKQELVQLRTADDQINTKGAVMQTLNSTFKDQASKIPLPTTSPLPESPCRFVSHTRQYSPTVRSKKSGDTVSSAPEPFLLTDRFKKDIVPSPSSDVQHAFVDGSDAASTDHATDSEFEGHGEEWETVGADDGLKGRDIVSSPCSGMKTGSSLADMSSTRSLDSQKTPVTPWDPLSKHKARIVTHPAKSAVPHVHRLRRDLSNGRTVLVPQYRISNEARFAKSCTASTDVQNMKPAQPAHVYRHPEPLGQEHCHPFASSPPQFEHVRSSEDNIGDDIRTPRLVIGKWPVETEGAPGARAVFSKSAEEVTALPSFQDASKRSLRSTDASYEVSISSRDEETSSAEAFKFGLPRELGTFTKVTILGPEANLTGTPNGTGLRAVGSSEADYSTSPANLLNQAFELDGSGLHLTLCSPDHDPPKSNQQGSGQQCGHIDRQSGNDEYDWSESCRYRSSISASFAATSIKRPGYWLFLRSNGKRQNDLSTTII